VIDNTLDHSRTPEAFAQPLSQFQVIKHKPLDMGTKVAAVQASVYQTAKQWDQGEYPVREISQAKLLATQVACEVADEAIQILGGHGYMREFPVERAWRDARLARIGARAAEIMKESIAKWDGLERTRPSSPAATPRSRLSTAGSSQSGRRRGPRPAAMRR